MYGFVTQVFRAVPGAVKSGVVEHRAAPAATGRDDLQVDHGARKAGTTNVPSAKTRNLLPASVAEVHRRLAGMHVRGAG
jgi:hypothetical protein